MSSSGILEKHDMGITFLDTDRIVRNATLENTAVRNSGTTKGRLITKMRNARKQNEG